MFASSLNLSNPKLPLFTARAKNTIDLALIKVVAHRQNPSQNPLPADPKSLERAYNDVFNAIPKRKQDEAMEKYQGLLTSAARTQAYGDLGQVNFASATSVVDQVKALPLPAELHFTKADVDDLNKQILAKKLVSAALHNIGHHANGNGGQATAAQQLDGAVTLKMGHRVKTSAGHAAVAAPQQAVVASSMNFAVVKVTCVKPNDLRKDEINMVVGTVDGVNAPLNAGPFFVGDFKKGQSIDLGATGQFFNFKLDQTVFPVSFPAFALGIESDLIHNQELSSKLAIALAITAAACSGIALATIALGLTGVIPAPAAIVIVIAGMIGSAAFGLGSRVVFYLTDDISEASGDTLVLDAPPAPGSVFERNITLSGFGPYRPGQYNVLLRWTAVQ